jgi:hypothetical protein
MIVLLASSTINYSPKNAPVTSFDEIGGFLPYTLFAGVVLYSLLKSKLKGALSGRVRSSFRLVGMGLLIGAGTVLVTVLAILFMIPATAPTVPSQPLAENATSGGMRLLNYPVFDFYSLLPLFMIVFPIILLLIATYLRKKTEIIEEPAEEEIVPEEARISTSENAYDEHRRAIIANYVEGKELMIHRGVPSSDITTPREFESSVIESVNEAKKDFVPLTRLFEEARFSVHPMDEPEKTRAEKHRKRLEDLSSGQGGD